jgi:hypothetical protein
MDFKTCENALQSAANVAAVSLASRALKESEIYFPATS